MVRVVEIARDTWTLTTPPPTLKRKVPFVGMMGWAVNSIAKAVEGSIPFLPKKINLFKDIFMYIKKNYLNQLYSIHLKIISLL